MSMLAEILDDSNDNECEDYGKNPAFVSGSIRLIKLLVASSY